MDKENVIVVHTCTHTHSRFGRFFKLKHVQICPKADLQNLWAGGTLKHESPSPISMLPNSPVDGKYMRTIGLIPSGRHAARLFFSFGVSDLGPICLSIHPCLCSAHYGQTVLGTQLQDRACSPVRKIQVIIASCLKKKISSGDSIVFTASKLQMFRNCY